MTLAYANGLLWAVGNGLTSTTLIVYFALEMGAAGVAISLVLAAPQLAGLLRLGAPRLIQRVGDRRRFCLWAYLLSDLLLAALPLVGGALLVRTRPWSLTMLVVLWSGYHLLEYCGTIALWSWLGDIAPLRIRGRFIGRRERWLTFGRLAGMTAAGLFTWYWECQWPAALRWIGFALAAEAGAIAMILSLVPLALIPALPFSAGGGGVRATPLGSLLAPFRDARFRRLLVYGCWFSTFNGITQAAQNIYAARRDMLGLYLFAMLALQGGMRLGQGAVSPLVGKAADRLGNRPLMIVSQALVAAGLLFYFVASPAQPWWVAGAWLLWIAYVGLNIALPNLMLKLAPGGNATPYIAAFFAVTGLCYGASTVAGGVALDWLRRVEPVTLGGMALDRFDFLFLFGFATRLLGVVWLLAIIEPGAWTLRDWWTQRGRSRRSVV